MRGVFSALLLLAATCPARFTDPPACPPSPLASYHPHETDCSSYYRCQGGHLTVLSCPQGHLFDPNLGACDLATTCRDLDVKTAYEDCPETPRCSGSEWGKTKPYPPDCTKYISCDFLGNSIIKNCPVGQHYGPVIEKCASPETANCPVCGLTTETPTTETPTTVTPSTTESTTTLAPVCPTAPFCAPEDVGKSYPYPPECNFYVYCANATFEEIRRCPGDKHFSVELRWCTDPETARCVQCPP